jgi:hypothetical protein
MPIEKEPARIPVAHASMTQLDVRLEFFAKLRVGHECDPLAISFAEDTEAARRCVYVPDSQ